MVGARSEWLLGRLEPLETANLPLPVASLQSEAESVTLVVIDGWSRTFQASRDPRGVRSLTESRLNLPGEHWSFVNGQLMGPSSRPGA